MLALMELLPWTANVTADEMVLTAGIFARIDRLVPPEVVGDLAMIFQELHSVGAEPCFAVVGKSKEAFAVSPWTLDRSRSPAPTMRLSCSRQVGIRTLKSGCQRSRASDVGGMNSA
jgi:dipeptide transport system ATP-binding protein